MRVALPSTACRLEEIISVAIRIDSRPILSPMFLLETKITGETRQDMCEKGLVLLCSKKGRESCAITRLVESSSYWMKEDVHE